MKINSKYHRSKINTRQSIKLSKPTFKSSHKPQSIHKTQFYNQSNQYSSFVQQLKSNLYVAPLPPIPPKKFSIRQLDTMYNAHDKITLIQQLKQYDNNAKKNSLNTKQLSSSLQFKLDQIQYLLPQLTKSINIPHKIQKNSKHYYFSLNNSPPSTPNTKENVRKAIPISQGRKIKDIKVYENWIKQVKSLHESKRTQQRPKYMLPDELFENVITKPQKLQIPVKEIVTEGQGMELDDKKVFRKHFILAEPVSEVVVTKKKAPRIVNSRNLRMEKQCFERDCRKRQENSQ